MPHFIFLFDEGNVYINHVILDYYPIRLSFTGIRLIYIYGWWEFHQTDKFKIVTFENTVLIILYQLSFSPFRLLRSQKYSQIDDDG